jgi:hypothetical protein
MGKMKMYQLVTTDLKRITKITASAICLAFLASCETYTHTSLEAERKENVRSYVASLLKDGMNREDVNRALRKVGRRTFSMDTCEAYDIVSPFGEDNVSVYFHPNLLPNGKWDDDAKNRLFRGNVSESGNCVIS